MRVIKPYQPTTLSDWYRAETRVFRLLERFSLDELRDIGSYWGVKHDGMTKAVLIKSLLVRMGNVKSNKHFAELKTK
jgi:hypothetical protein